MGGVTRAEWQKLSAQMQVIRGSFLIDDLRIIIKVTESQTNIYYHHTPPILSPVSG